MMFGSKRWGRPAAIVVMALLLAMGAAGTAFASNEEIRSVAITVTSEVEANQDEGSVSAEVESNVYRLESCEFAVSKESWKPGEVPKAKIVLKAEDGYYFGSMGMKTVHLRGATYHSISRSTDKKTLTVFVKLKGAKGTLDDVEDAYWRDSPLGKAAWSKVEGLASYEVKLYRDGTLVYHVDRTNSLSYDFFPYMTNSGIYYFRVRAVAKSDSEAEYLKEGGWRESDGQEITKRDAAQAVSAEKDKVSGKGDGPGEEALIGQEQGAGLWRSDANGWWYREADGSYPKNGWRSIDGKWYLFDGNGYIKTGWQVWGDHEYYLTSNGDMVTGWLQYNRVWYYMDESGAKVTAGWLYDNGHWYYMNMDGSMATGWLKQGEKRYYLDPATGQMVTDRVVEQYYINSDGFWVP